MTKWKVLVTVNDEYRDIRMGFNNPDRESTSDKSIAASKKYVTKMVEYYANPEKAPLNYIDFLENDVQPELEYANMAIGYDYKNNHPIFVKNKNLQNVVERNLKYIENSNLNQFVISFDNSFINENITISKLYEKMTKQIIPKFLESAGYDKSKVSYQLSFHTDTENFHFHFAFMEKKQHINQDGLKNYNIEDILILNQLI